MARLDKDRIRRDAEEEAREDDQQEARIQLRFQKWKNRTLGAGAALLVRALSHCGREDVV